MGGHQCPAMDAALGADPAHPAHRASGSPGPGGVADAPPETDGAPWTHTDALVAAGACTLDLLNYLLFSEMDGVRRVTPPGLLLVALSALPLLVRRRHPVPALAVVLAVEAAIDLSTPASTHFGAVLMVSLYSVARARPAPVTAAAAAATTVLTTLSQSHLRVPSWQALAGTSCSTLLVAGAGLAVARWQRRSRPTANCWPTARWPTNAAASHGSCTTSWRTTSPPCS
ncbi:hypothetical protein ACFQ0M_03590 [Kitasatospora aburaviensis]